MSQSGILIAVTLDEASISKSTADVEHERQAAIFDLIEENQFDPVGYEGGKFKLKISMHEKRLALEINDENDALVVAHLLSLGPFRRIVKDYFMICDSYFEAIKSASPQRIEAIDMARRGIHNEGSEILKERLEGKITVDFDTARRLFTLICALFWKGI